MYQPAQAANDTSDSQSFAFGVIGDIPCGGAESIRSRFDTFEHPLERLDKLREVFFDEPGKTLGATMPVKTQENLGLPENVRFTQNRVAFSMVNVQGSSNSLLPWSGLGETAPTPERLAEVEHRTDAVLDQVQHAADDLQRITVDGSANATNYVRFTVAGNRSDSGRRREVPPSSASGAPRNGPGVDSCKTFWVV